jgi:hypothetical protein
MFFTKRIPGDIRSRRERREAAKSHQAGWTRRQMEYTGRQEGYTVQAGRYDTQTDRKDIQARRYDTQTDR